ncbi:unnamed protein product [Knipowitschia caucasica]|uniref:Ig-like domain-containing protein n=1 Tax=Knipowitschia caucasica TaxID=637954 RepID=A0AAV2MMQ7_KNICA
MYGCEWDDETGEVNGYEQDAFDGEDFIVFDLKTLTWIAPRQEAFITKLKLDSDEGYKAYNINYYTQICPTSLKKYVSHGKDALMRTVLPSISLLQKSSSSPVTCHATGFFPGQASIFWTKDGDIYYEGVDFGETLPNNDETFQTSVELDVSSVPSEDWGRYNCVFRLSGYKEEIITRLDKAAIRTNEKPTSSLIVTVVVLGVCAAVAAAAVGFFIYKKKNAKRPPTPVSDREVEEELNPK